MPSHADLIGHALCLSCKAFGMGRLLEIWLF